jgi:hypothetical protein
MIFFARWNLKWISTYLSNFACVMSCRNRRRCFALQQAHVPYIQSKCNASTKQQRLVLWSDGGCMQSDADAGGGPSYRSTAIRKAKLYGPSKIIPAFLVVAHHTAIRGWNRGPSSSWRPGPRAQQNGMERAQINLVVEPLKCAATLRCLRGAVTSPWVVGGAELASCISRLLHDLNMSYRLVCIYLFTRIIPVRCKENKIIPQ